MKNYKKIKATLIALTMSLAITGGLNVSATDASQTNKELSYVLNVLPRYLDSNEIYAPFF